uniref:CSD domain-containing protein n=1 Tax=Alexandrium monilatum TaxID=311494 RepID=A0A7S4VT21_9DINO
MTPGLTGYAAMAGAAAPPEGTGWTAVGGPAAAGQAPQAGAFAGGPAMGGGVAAMGGAAFAQPGGSMKSGTVKLWNEEKGFGFIAPGTGGDDIFVHRSTLEDGLSLAQGSTVRYEAQWNPQRNKFAVTRCTGAQAGKGGAAGGKGGAPFAGGAGFASPPPVADGSMQQGTVKVWYDDKGFGFLVPDSGGEDVFVHRNAISDGQALVQGSTVSFRIAWNEQKGKYLATECTGAVGEVKGGKGKVKGYGKAGGPDMSGARPMPYGAGAAMTGPAPAAGEYNMQQAFPPQPAAQNLQWGGQPGLAA